jgi:pyruvate ferredoxin oxidoreductase beta subunit
MNTGIQRSGATPYDADTTTSPAGVCSTGNNRPKKDLPQILVAHGSPYVATATMAYPMDLMKKVEKAMNTPGPCYIQVHAPCCTGWGFDSAKTMEIGRMAVECGLWVNYEIENGELVSQKKVKRVPVDAYLQAQKRFRHLFRPERNEAEIAKIQAIADKNAKKYGIDIE